jgi:hypothetical protein
MRSRYREAVAAACASAPDFGYDRRMSNIFATRVNATDSGLDDPDDDTIQDDDDEEDDDEEDDDDDEDA